MSIVSIALSALAVAGWLAWIPGLRPAFARASHRGIHQNRGQEEEPPPKPPIDTPPQGDAKVKRPRTDERETQRDRMVTRQIAARGVKNARVLKAMRQVPRHWFVPDGVASRAYADRPLPIGFEQTISQPYIVALMTELLQLKPGDKVLEVGTGSGYQAAVLSELTHEVFTIEIVEPLAKRTNELLRSKGYDNIQTRIGDGYRGWPAAAPFDAIIVTCAPDAPPPPLLQQLAVGGRMCIPVGTQWTGQELVVLRKKEDGSIERRSIIPVRFVPMTGQARKRGG